MHISFKDYPFSGKTILGFWGIGAKIIMTCGLSTFDDQILSQNFYSTLKYQYK